MKSQFRAINRFISKVKSTSSIDWISSSWTFQVEDISVAGFSLPQWASTYFVTADFAQTGKEEIFRIVNTAWDVLTYDKRIPVWGYVKPAHTAWASIRVNDVADILNEMSDNIDNFGDINQISGTQTISVWWGVFNNSGIVYNIASQTFIVTSGQLIDNSTNYVHFDLLTRLFVISASSTYWNWVCVASIVVAGGVIWTITDLRPGFSSAYWPFPSQTGNAWKVLYTDWSTTSWQTVSTVLPNASTTVAGKVEVATQAQVNAWTSVGETGAILAVSPPELVAGFSPISHTHTWYAPTVHTHSEYWIVKNGTLASISVSWPAYSNHLYSSETSVLTNPTIATFSLFSNNWEAWLEYWNWSSWVTLYYNGTYWTTLSFYFLLQEWKKYRCHTYVSGGWASASASLTYTV